jgi:curved DNA-binding protein CbpA
MANTAPPNYYAILQVSESATPEQIRAAYKRAALKTHPDRVAEDSPDRPLRTRQFQLVNDAYYTLHDAGRRREYDAVQRRMFGGSGGGASYSTAGHASPEFEDDDPFESAFPGGFPTSDQDQGIPRPSSGTNAGAAGAGGPAGAAFSWAWNYFTNSQQQQQQQQQQQESEAQARARQSAEEAQFGDVFEEMLREEGLGPDSTTAQDQNKGGGPLAKFWGMVGGLSGGAIGFIVANVPGMVAGAVAGNRLGAIRDARGKSVYAVFQELPQTDRARLLSQLAARVFSHAVGI